MGYNQGYADMWNARDGIIGNAFEYHAKYNLGENVSWENFTFASPIWQNPSNAVISTDKRGTFRPIYYMAYNHFHNRLGREMPYTLRVITEKQTDEKTHNTVTDGAGFGTLFFNNPEQEASSGIKDTWYEPTEFVSVIGNRIVFKACNNFRVAVFDLIGRPILSKKITSDSDEIQLNSGIYIVRSDKFKTFKITI